MNKITELMDSMDLSKLVPELGGLMSKASSIAAWAVMIGPLVLLVLGLLYLFKPPAEANHRFGFRTYFGMGALQNRTEHAMENADNISENLQTSESKIRDADMADTMVKYSKTQILMEAGISMLSQTNKINDGILTLLR